MEFGLLKILDCMFVNLMVTLRFVTGYKLALLASGGLHLGILTVGVFFVPSGYAGLLLILRYLFFSPAFH